MEDPFARLQEKMFFLVVLLFILCRNSLGLHFDTDSSYCEFERWNASINGTLKFEFKTNVDRALLIYMDDGGDKDFLELILEDGIMRFRFRIRNNARTFYLGENLADSTWHEVTIKRSGRSSSITLDGITREGSVEGPDEELTLATNLYVGGLPVDADVLLTSSPAASLYQHFLGRLRNLRYKTRYNRYHFERPELLKRVHVGEDPLDVCGSMDPCENRGLCMSRDDGLYCDCTGTGFEGETCGKERQAVSATFDGTAYISYSLDEQPIDSTSDDVTFQFRTRHPNGLILHFGDVVDFMYVALEMGNLVVAVDLGGGEFRATIRPTQGVPFTDNAWHKVAIIRRGTLVEVKVDNNLEAEGNTLQNFETLTANGEFFIGGAPEPAELLGSSVGEKFLGNLQDVTYNGNQGYHELLDLARRRDPFTHIKGNILFEVIDVSATDPITFLTEESFLLLPKWNGKATGDILFSFRTNEPDSVIMYNRGSGSKKEDFFAFELVKGYLYLVLNLGAGAIRHQAPTAKLDDGHWHKVALQRKERQGTIIVDDVESEDGHFQTPAGSTHLNLGDHLVLGGISTMDEGTSLPMELFSAITRKGFVGCIKNFAVDGSTIDFSRHISDQGKEDDIKLYCRQESNKCEPRAQEPCRHGGVCKEGWNRFICDCRMTSYIGPICQQAAVRLSFNGLQFVRITLPSTTQTKVEDIFFRFKTKFPNGVLLHTQSTRSIDFLQVELHEGRLKVTIDFGQGKEPFAVGSHLDDNNWHTVQVLRQENSLTVTLDNSDRTEAFKNTQEPAPEDFSGDALDHHLIDIGGFVDPDTRPGSVTGFKGYIEHFIYNGRYYFELAANEGYSNVEISASREAIQPRPILTPITFQTKEVFAELQTQSTFQGLTFFFQFRTTEADGLILFDRGDEQDFIAVEILGGRLHYVFNQGSGTTSIQDVTMRPLNDNMWHEVWIYRDSNDQHILMVDGVPAADRAASGASTLNLGGLLRVGGLQESEFSDVPEMVQSMKGYQGCFASLEINYEPIDIFDSADSIESKEDLIEGCTELSTVCSDDICKNGGLCLAGWEEVSCDCSATSFTGKHCNESSVTYQFGPAGGLISLRFTEDEWRTTDRDEISMGFATTSDNAILMRIDSATSDDYIEMEIVRGILVVTYDFGTEDIALKESFTINDGLYHVVHFSRRGANATLQIDNNEPQLSNPKGRQAQHFNQQAIVNVGGRGSSPQRRRRRRRNIDQRSYEGILSGISFNELRPLDIAAEGDPRISISGDVSRVHSPVYDVTWPSRAPNKIGTAQTTLETLPEYSTDNVPRGPSKDPTLASPSGSSSGRHDEDNIPEKKTPLILPTADGIFVTEGRTIFQSLTDCLDGADEDCTEPTISPNATEEDSIFTLETTDVEQVPPKPKGDPECDDDEDSCPSDSAGSGADENEKDDTVIKFTATTNIPSKIKPNQPSGKGPDKENETGNSVKKDAGLQFIGQTGIVIGVVVFGAVLFIAVVLLLYRCRNRNEGSYHINESRNYDEATRTSLLPSQQTNGAVPPKPKPKLPPEYATKEWYV